MPTWSSILLIGLFVVFIAYISGRLLPTRLTGRTYFKKLLWENGVDWRSLPDACIQDFIADALKYAKSVSSAPANPVIPKVHFYVEFERMLKIHAFGVAELLKEEDCGDMWQAQEAVLKKHGALDK